MINLLGGDVINVVLSFVGVLFLIYGGLKVMSKGMKRALIPIIIGVFLMMNFGTSGFDLLLSFFN